LSVFDIFELTAQFNGSRIGADMKAMGRKCRTDARILNRECTLMNANVLNVDLFPYSCPSASIRGFICSLGATETAGAGARPVQQGATKRTHKAAQGATRRHKPLQASTSQKKFRWWWADPVPFDKTAKRTHLRLLVLNLRLFYFSPTYGGVLPGVS
jgi:hypothetical protein